MQRELTIQEIVDLYSLENLGEQLEKELANSNTNLYLPEPALPTILQAQSQHQRAVINYINGEPILDKDVEIEELDIKTLRSLFLFITEYCNFYSTRHTVVEIEVSLLTEQLKAYKSSLAVSLKDQKVAAGMIKEYQNIDTACNLINTALVQKKAQEKIMKTRYDAYRRLLNALSREATNRGNFNEYNNQSHSGQKWNKGGGFGGKLRV